MPFRTHYEVWHWPQGGAPHIPDNLPIDEELPCNAMDWPEDHDGFGGLPVLTIEEARNLLKAWNEQDPGGEYRIVKVTTQFEVVD